MEPIILASASPRRQEILRQVGLVFTVMPPEIREELDPNLTPEEQTIVLAKQKIDAVLQKKWDHMFPWVLGADTIISLEGKVIGKPASREEALSLLEGFSGKTHYVITGLALYNHRKGNVIVRSNRTSVNFNSLQSEEIEWYLDTGEWQGVAGGYRIQGKASLFIRSIEGSFSSVMGLPISDLYGMLRESGYTL
jgi:septum formation protein